MTDLLETLMILSFGMSWPISIRKSWVSRTAKGKSVVFEMFIWLGYIFGIIRKCMIYISAKPGSLELPFFLAWFFYVFNIAAITFDMVLYVRNRRFDKEENVEIGTAFSDKN